MSKSTYDPSRPNKIGIKEGFGYMWGDIANMLILSFVTTFLKVFYTDVLYIDTKKLAVLFLVVRLFDAINDPIWGFIVDSRKPGKDGKFRPYLKWVSIPLVLSAIVCFIPLTKMGLHNETLILIFAYVTYTLFGVMYTGMNIPYGSLASVITDDSEGRTLLSTFRSVGGGVGGAPITILLPMFLYEAIDGGEKHLKAEATLIACIIVAVFTVAAYFACYKGTKERVKSLAQPPKRDIKATYGGMFTSMPFVSLMIANIFMSGLIEYQSVNPYLYRVYFAEAPTYFLSLQTIAHYLPMALLILFVPKISAHTGKKEICGAGLALSSASTIILYIIRAPQSNPMFYLAMSFLTGLGLAFTSILCWALVMDVIDYQELKTNRRDEGSIYAVITFARKLGQTFAASGMLWLLDWAGYSGKALVQAEGVADKIYTLTTIVPAIGYTIMFIIIAFIYPLTKKKLAVMHEELTAKRIADGEIEPTEA